MSRGLPLSILMLLVLSSPQARAWDPVSERPGLPIVSTAGEDGAMSLWRNPANLAFDQDPSYGILYSQTIDETGDAGVAAARNLGPIGIGGAYRSSPAGEGWWTVSSGFGLKLGEHLSVGTHLGWQIPEGPENNFVTWDLGLGWRPFSWMGMSVIAQNIGDPAPDLASINDFDGQVEEKYGGGIVLRPIGNKLLIGADYLFTDLFSNDDSTTPSPDGLLEGSVRLSPVDGLVLRAYINDELTVGGGLEVFFGRHGVGANAQSPIDDADGSPRALLYATSSQNGERLFGSGRRVAGFVIDEVYPYQPQTGLLGSRSGESYMSLLNRIKKASTDPGVRGIFIHLEQTPFSVAQIQELRSLLQDARSQGKKVVVYLDRSTSNGAYLLASAADRVLLHPAASLNLVGLSAELRFLAGTFDLVGIGAQYVKRAEYKSAPEQYTRTHASSASREQINALLDQTFDKMVEDIADSRSRTVEQIARMIDEGPFTGQEALDQGLVDALVYPDQIEEQLKALHPRNPNLDLRYGLEGQMQGWRAPNEIAVIYVDGVIVTGKSRSSGGLLSPGRQAGSETIVRQLTQARRDPSVKAVVMRVDSPGGSAFASDEIWRAVERLKRRDKPVVVSMGGTAASGGYYVAAGATAIYAEPGTVTGSIGVYSGKFNVEGLYEKLGVSVEQYTRGRNAAMYSLSRPLDENEYAAMDRMVADTYRQFTEKVRQGRRMSEEEVEAVARGRVWTGTAAKENGLVDELGGFPEAVSRARQEAGIRPRAEVALITYNQRGSTAGELTRSTVQAMLGLESGDASALLPPEVALIHQWHQLSSEPVWAVMPYTLELR
ncbi:MAG: signal peptide peptidase SppA [Myxococcota bacterium]